MPNESKEVRFGYREQTDFDTIEVEGGAFEEVSCEPFSPDTDVTIHELPMAHGSFNPVEQNTIHSIQGNMPKFPVNFAVDINDIDQFLYAHFQKVIELADTEFTKTFTYFTTHPDYTLDEGHFLTWVRRNPVASTSSGFSGCIAPRFKLSGERDGMINFESDWVAHGNSQDTFNPSGTWTPKTGQNILLFNSIVSATLSHGASLASPLPLTMKNFEVEGLYEVDKLGHSASNGFDSYGLKDRSGSFKINLLRDAAIDEALLSYKIGEMVQLSIDINLMTITVTGKIEALEYDPDGLLGVSLTCKMLGTYSVGAWGEPLTIVVNNSIDRGWPAA